MSAFELLPVTNIYESSNLSQSWSHCCCPGLCRWNLKLVYLPTFRLILSAQPSVLLTMKTYAGSKTTRNTLDWGPYSVIWEGFCVLCVWQSCTIF